MVDKVVPEGRSQAIGPSARRFGQVDPMDPMTMPGLDSFGLTMRGLEAGLRVHHIAAFDLNTCNIGDALTTVLSDPIFADFDQIPVRNRTQRIVGVLLRAQNSGSGKA